MTRCAPNKIAAFAACLLLLWGTSVRAAPLDTHARRFVTLALTLTRMDGQAIDAYFGPPALQPPPGATPPTPDGLRASLVQLRTDMAKDAKTPRRDRLLARVDHLLALLAMMQAPKRLSFAQEAQQVYGVALPHADPRRLARVKAELAALLPGKGDLANRVSAYRERFVVPYDRRVSVFDAALAQCRARTAKHWKLPHGEKLSILWQPAVDAAWHQYKGRLKSGLMINPAAVSTPGTALDVACHEAYPGHHAQFLMLAAEGMPVEDTVVILRSPEQVLREGAANYGVDLAFPLAERIAFTRDVLFPLAQFDPKEAERFVRIHALVNELSLSVMPVLRDWRDGRLTRAQAETALEQGAMIPSAPALLQFTDTMGAYVTGYTVARDLIRDCVAARGGDAWASLRAIVAKLDISALQSCRKP